MHVRVQIADGLNIVYRGNSSTNEDYFNQVVFWMPVTFFIVIFGHLIIIMAFFYRKTDIPPFFYFPRLEIMFGYFCTPIITLACAGLYEGDRSTIEPCIDCHCVCFLGDALLATWMLIAFPTAFLCWGLSVIWNTFFVTPLTDRRVQMFVGIGEHYEHHSNFLRRAYAFLFGRQSQRDVAQPPTLPPGQGQLVCASNILQMHLVSLQVIELPPLQSRPRASSSYQTHEMPGLEMGSFKNEEEEEEETTTTSYTNPFTISTITPESTETSYPGFHDFCHFVYGFLNATLLYILLGRRQPSAHWVGIRDDGIRFMAKYGLLFEEYRGPPVVNECDSIVYACMSVCLQGGNLCV